MTPSDKDSESRILRAKWDQRYGDSDRQPPAAAVLVENLHLLPTKGRALDLACGLGESALLLARQGLHVAAWDLSRVAIERLQQEAGSRDLQIESRVRDVCKEPPEPASFDVILVSHFLDRDLAPALTEALLPGGLLFYQTFIREAVSDCGPSNPAFRLAANELLRLFSTLEVRFYREEGRVGDLQQGTRDIAQLVAQMPIQLTPFP